MAALDLDASLRRAAERLGRGRTPRRDRGRSRLPPPVQDHLAALLAGPERPPMKQVLRSLEAFCQQQGHSVPARATVYAYMSRAPTPRWPVADLPASVRATLHNLDPAGEVPGPQLVQRAFNAGDTAAVSFASSMPWLCLYQADELSGWRPKSRGLLRAVMAFRKIR